MYAFAVFSLALLAGQVSGYALNTRSPVYALMRRQSLTDGGDGGDDSGIPAQCQDVCAAFENAANNASCADPSCLCAPAVAQSFVGCLDCALSLDPDPSLESEAQDDLSQFSSACAQSGINVGALSLSISSVAAPTGAASESVFFSTISKTDTDSVPASTAASTAGASSPSGSGGAGGSSGGGPLAQKANGAAGSGAVSGVLVAAAAALLASAL